MAKRKKEKKKKAQAQGNDISLGKAPLQTHSPAKAASQVAGTPSGDDNAAMQPQEAALAKPARTEQKKKIVETEISKTGEVTAGQGTSPRKISMVTCCAGMFLTFVLGIYLGTLVPGIVNTAEKAATPKVSAPPANEQPQPGAQASARQQLDPQLKTVIADLEKRAAANPDSAADWINLGNIYFDAHMPQDAIRAYERALTLAPRNADVLTDLGIMHRETGDFAKAVATFRKAIEVDPGHQNAMFNEGVVLANDLHKNEEAIAAWQRLLDVNPGAISPGGVPLAEMIKRLR